MTKLNEYYDEQELIKKIRKICKKVRKDLVKKYNDEDLYGCCVEASDIIKEKLAKENIIANIEEGWCIYDDSSSCSNRGYDEHTLVLVPYKDNKFYVDVTATQFYYFLYEKIQKIIITKEKPYWFKEGKEEPLEL